MGMFKFLQKMIPENVITPSRIYGERVKNSFGRIGTVLDEIPVYSDRTVIYYLVQWDDTKQLEEVHCRKLKSC